MLFYLNIYFDSNIDEPAFFWLVFAQCIFFWLATLICLLKTIYYTPEANTKWDYTCMCFIGEMPVWEHLGKPEEARRVSDLDEGMNEPVEE